MKRVLAVLLILPVLLASCVTGQPSSILVPIPTPAPEQAGEGAIPLDPAIRTGKLDNGLTYYIRQNDQPTDRAEIRLIINAGSVLEDDDQLGLAHFLEHMLFNGTRSFESTELVDFLESLGMEFGPDVNAYTSFDETVYMLQVPTDNPEMLDTALKVLEEWAAYATLDPEEIEKERGVVVEEWRLRDQDAYGRIRDQMIPLLLNNSRYAERLPIGDMDIIRNAPPEAVRRFYETWYRPDLMSIIAVGDFDDVDAVEAQIRERFSTLPAAANPQPRPSFEVPPQQGTSGLVITDPELPDTVIQLLYTQPVRQITTREEYRSLLVDLLAQSMLNGRLGEVGRTAGSPFLGAGVDKSNLVRPTDATSVYVQVEEGKELAGLGAVATELERVRRYGFTETELERAKGDTLSFYENAYNERENRDSADYADEYSRLVLENEASPGIAYEYDLVKEALPGVTLEEVNAAANALTAGQDRAVMLLAPEKDGVKLPTEAELIAAYDAVAGEEIEPYVDSEPGAALMEAPPPAVAIVDERTIPELGVTDITLANGVRVILKPTDFQDDEIIITATSPGGNSLVDDEDYPEASLIDEIVIASGAGDLDQNQLDRLLSGKRVNVSPYVGELDEGFTGYASPEELETAFQLIYLFATQPRVDDDPFEVLKTQLRADLKNRDRVPETALIDALTEILCGDGIRCVPFPEEVIDGLDLERGFEIYRDRFADLGDATFTFVGNFDPEQVTELAQRYLGNLPTTGRREKWKDVSPDLPKGVIERDVNKGIADRSISVLIFTGPFDPTLENQARLDALETILSARLRNELREALSGTYAPSVNASWQRRPREEYSVGVQFGSDPKRAEELTQAAFDEIKKLQDEGPTAAEVEAAIKQELQDYEEQLEINDFWAFALEDALANPDGDYRDLLDWQDAMQALTPEDIQEAARAYLPADRFVRATLLPEK
jgi:zinc protease